MVVPPLTDLVASPDEQIQREVTTLREQKKVQGTAEENVYMEPTNIVGSPSRNLNYLEFSLALRRLRP